MPLIEIKGAAKGYGPRGSRTEVLHDINLTLDLGHFRKHERTRLVTDSLDVAFHTTVHPQATGKLDVAGDRGSGPDQTVDRAWFV